MQIPYLNQILLFLVVVILTTLLTLSGIQVIAILKEIREMLKRVNKSMDDINVISNSVAKPIAGISGFMMGLRSGRDFFNLFLNKAKKQVMEDSENE